MKIKLFEKHQSELASIINAWLEEKKLLEGDDTVIHAFDARKGKCPSYSWKITSLSKHRRRGLEVIRPKWSSLTLPDDLDKKLAIPLRDLGPNLYMPHTCEFWRLITLGMLVRMSGSELLCFERLGPGRVNGLKEFLASQKLSLRMKVPIGPEELQCIKEASTDDTFRYYYFSRLEYPGSVSSLYPTIGSLTQATERQVEEALQSQFSGYVHERENINRTLPAIKDTLRRAGLSLLPKSV